MKFTIYDLRLTRVVALGAVGVLTALAGSVAVQAESMLLTGATVHTVTGETMKPGQVLVTDGKISAVGASVPTNGATVINLEGLHLYPGMIALNTELGLVEIDAVRSTRDQREVGDFTPEVKSWLAVNPDSELLPVARANGVAYFESPPQGAVVAGTSALMATTGWTTEQMALRTNLALHIYWPEFGLDTTPKDRARNKDRWKSLEDQDKERREQVKALDDFFLEARAYAKARTAATNGTAFKSVPAWEAMLAIVRGEVPLTIHADDARQIRSAVKWAETNHFKMVLAESRDAWKVAGLLASNNIPVIYNHLFNQPGYDTDAYDAQFAAPAVLHAAGVKVILGLSSYRDSLVKNLPYEAAQAVAYGLPAAEGLKSITLYPAQVAGVADRLGSLEAGKDATLVVTDGDLLDIRANVKRMWIAGKEVNLESRHTKLYEKYKSRPR